MMIATGAAGAVGLGAVAWPFVAAMAPDAQTVAAGAPVEVAVPRTLADGQQTAAVGAVPLAVLRERIAARDAVGVTDAELAAAVRFAFIELRIDLEPSCASELAALLSMRV